MTVDQYGNLIFGLGITSTTSFQMSDGSFKDVESCGEVRCPILVVYARNGDLKDYIKSESSHDGRFGELAFSKNQVYIDCEIIDGEYSFGSDLLTTMNHSKDAAIIAIQLE